jgi:hypothetical protein
MSARERLGAVGASTFEFSKHFIESIAGPDDVVNEFNTGMRLITSASLMLFASQVMKEIEDAGIDEVRAEALSDWVLGFAMECMGSVLSGLHDNDGSEGSDIFKMIADEIGFKVTEETIH